MPDHDNIPSLVDAFAADLAALIRRAALEAVQQALGGGRAPVPEARWKPGGPPAKAATASRAAKVKKTSTAKPGKTGGKRDPAEIEKLTEKLLTYITANPGLRMEHIKAGLGVEKRDLVLPIQKLIAAKRITFKGIKRSRKYTAAATSNGGLVLLPKKARKPAEAKAETTST
jgi:hypothetical protein